VQSSQSRYTTAAIALHWLMALMILGSIILGLYMVGLELSPRKLKLYSWHKWAGVTIFLFTCLRVLWRLTHPAPPLPPNVPKWQHNAAHVTHLAIYVLLFAIPLSGWLMSSAFGFQVVYFGVLPIPDLLAKNKVLAEQLKELHEALNIALWILLFVHVVAAVKHHVIDRDSVLHRMLPIVKDPTGVNR
jgi:cytochrome b561